MRKVLGIIVSIIVIALGLWVVDAFAAAYPTGVGGTGTTAAPSAGQTLIGTGSFTYTPGYLLCSGNCSISSASGTITVNVPPQTSSTISIYPVSAATGTFSIVGDGSYITVSNPATSTIKVSLSTAQVLQLLSATSPLTYNSSTGQFSCASCLTSLNGALLVANNLSDVASTTVARNNLGLGSIATFSKTDYLPSTTVYVSTVNGSSGAITITSSSLGVVPFATTSINNTASLAFHIVGDGTTITSTVSGATTTLSLINTGNWAGTWQGTNSTTYYLANNPSNFIALTGLSASGTGLTYNSSTGVYTWTNPGYITSAPPTTTINGTQANAFLIEGDSATVTTTVNGTTTIFKVIPGVYLTPASGTALFYPLSGNPSNFITLTSLTASGTGLSYNSSTGQFSWTNPGYASSTNVVNSFNGATGTVTYSALQNASITATLPITWSGSNVIACPTCLTTSTFNATGTAYYVPSWNASGTALTATSSIVQSSSTSFAVNIGGSSTPNISGTYVASGTANGYTSFSDGSAYIWYYSGYWFITTSTPLTGFPSNDFYQLTNYTLYPPSFTGWTAQGTNSGSPSSTLSGYQTVAVNGNPGTTLIQGQLTIGGNAVSTSYSAPLIVQVQNSQAQSPAILINNAGTQSGFAFSTNGTIESQIRGDNLGDLVFASRAEQYFGYPTDFGSNVVIDFGNGQVHIQTNGNVDVATTTDDNNKLHVVGTADAQSLAVGTTTTSTYVANILNSSSTATTTVNEGSASSSACQSMYSGGVSSSFKEVNGLLESFNTGNCS
jgi:hypothetical protein